MIRSEDGTYYLKADYCWLALEEECYVYCYSEGTRVAYIPDGEEPPPPEPPQPEPPQPEPEPQPPIDVTPPITAHDFSGRNKDAINVSLFATDDLSGVDVTKYIVYKEDNIEHYDGTEFLIGLDEVRKIVYFSIDKAGNREPSHEITIEKIEESKTFKNEKYQYCDCPSAGEAFYSVYFEVTYFKISEIVFIDEVYISSDDHNIDVVGLQLLGDTIKTRSGIGPYWGDIGAVDWSGHNNRYKLCAQLRSTGYDRFSACQKFLSAGAIPFISPGGIISLKECNSDRIFVWDIPSQTGLLKEIWDMINPFQTKTHEIKIDSSITKTSFSLRWVGSDLDLILHDPNDREINPNTPAIDPYIEFLEGDNYEQYSVLSPMLGTWTMEVIAVDVPQDGEEYIAIAQVSPDLDDDAKINITEQFSGSDSDIFDLSYKAIMFSPVGDGASYMACIRNINQLPTDPTGGQDISLSDDGYEYISLAGQRTVSICGSIFAGFYVGSNGYITFSEGYIDNSKLLADHFDTPRVSCLFNDFDPSSSGTVSIKQLNDRVVVTWEQIPQYDIGGSSTFQVEIYFDGTIQLAWLEVSVLDGIVGLSDGQGLRSSFEETDLSELACTTYIYDIVIGDFENDMTNWGPTWEDSVVFAFSTNPTTVTSGSQSLRVQLRPGGYWALQWNAPTVPGLQPGTTLQFDVTMIQSEWTQNNWTQVANKIAINSDGPSGWKEYSPIAIDRITGQSASLDWGSLNPDALKTYSVDISNYDATGATWFRINISLQQNPVNGAGYFYIDNVQLLGLKP